MMTKNVVLILLASLTLTGCGFALRSPSTNGQANPLPVLVQANGYGTFEQILQQKLSQVGFAASDENTIAKVEVIELQQKSYRLVGVLTEIRMVLTANVRYTLPNGTIKQSPILVERSYQYNENDVSSSDKQSVQVQNWLYESLAERISEQYHTLYQSNP